MTTIVELASQAYKALEIETRIDSKEFYKLKDSAPDWMTDLLRAAHGGMMPNDWRYRFIHSALANIADADDESSRDGLLDCVSEWADGDLSIYNIDLIAWLESDLTRGDYVNEGMANSGKPDNIWQALRGGQYEEIYETYSLIIDFLAERIAEMKEETA